MDNFRYRYSRIACCYDTREQILELYYLNLDAQDVLLETLLNRITQD